MLYANAKRNQEFVDDEEQSKKIVFDRTIKWVNKLYPADNKEASLKPGTLTNLLQYGYDSVFESWRSSIEQLLSATYHDDKVPAKSYEIIKKYNQLSSYLKNIVSMNKLSAEDELKIKTDFDKMKDKLVALRKLAIQNNFLDKQDLIEMCDKINGTTSEPKSEYDKVTGDTTNMTSIITSKLSAKDEYLQMYTDKASLIDVANATTPANVIQLRYFPFLVVDIPKVDGFTTANGLPDTVKYTDENKRNEIHNMYNNTFIPIDTIIKDTHTITEIQKTIVDIAQAYTDITGIDADIQTDLGTLDDAYITNRVTTFIATEEKKEVAQLNVDLARYNAVPQPRAFTITAPAVVVQPVNGKSRAQKIKYASDLLIDEKYIRDLKTFNDRLAIFTKADLEYKDAQTQIVQINADIANIVTKYTALIPKLIADIKADVVKYTGEYNALDTAYRATKLFTDFQTRADYFDTDQIKTIQDLADIEREVIQTRNSFDVISKNIKNTIPTNLNPTVAPTPSILPPPRVATTWAQYSALYFATFRAKPPAGHWNRYQANGILVK